MEEKTKIILGAIVIIGVMIASYKLFPRNVEYEDSFNIQDELKRLEKDLKETVEENPNKTITPDEIIISGPGGCTTIAECNEYCSLPENEQECIDAYTF